jgi:hypothetical protein
MTNSKFKSLLAERSKTPELISYQTLRRAIGWMGISLPFALLLGSIIFGQCSKIQPSISHYYYTNMREVFEGTLCAVSLFLFSYRGYTRLDSYASNLAGLGSLGVALFPTDIKYNADGITCFPCQEDVASIFNISFHSTIHFSCAAVFFVTLALISIFLFTKSKHVKEKQTPEKRKRNVIYRLSGIIMLASISCIGIYVVSGGNSYNQTIFWCETLALLFFGISWLTKGEALFGDKHPQSE